MDGTQGHVVAVAGAKGGSGKSTVALALAVDALDRGLRVLLVDLDERQRTATHLAAVLEPPRPVVQGIDVRLLRDQLAEERGRYDLVVIDTPGRADASLVAAVASADVALLPTSGSASDLDAFGLSLGIADDAAERAALMGQPRPKVVALRARVNARTVIGRELGDTIAEAGAGVLETVLPISVSFAEHPAVTRYATSSTAAKAIQALTDEVFALLGREGE